MAGPQRSNACRSLTGIALGVFIFLGVPAAQAAYPGGNGEILFERSNKLWTISPQGPVNSERRLANLGRPTENPEYSPNGRRIAFASDLGAGQSWQVIVIRANGTRPKVITDGVRKCLSARAPSWSPNGRKLAFICNDRGFPSSFEVYTINVDGTGARRITSMDEVDYVKWNPANPGQIAFVNSQLLYTVSAGGGPPQLLNGDPPGITGAGWFDFDYAPNGSFLVAESGEGNLHLVSTTTGEYSDSLIGGIDAQVEPTVSPDGRLLAFVNSGSSVFDIHAAPITGATSGFPLTATATVSERDPTWRPIR